MAKFVILAVALALAAAVECCPSCGCGSPFPISPVGIPAFGAPALACVTPTQTFRVALDNCGPAPLPLAPVNAPPQQAPTIDRGIVPLPAAVPAPRTISNIARCVKTIVKPQPINQLISIPAVQRFLQTSHTPVVETINFEGIPVNCPDVIAPSVAPLTLPGLAGVAGLSGLAGLAGVPAIGSPFAPCGIPAPILPPIAPCGIPAPILPPFLPPCAPVIPPFLPPCAPVIPPCF